MGQVVRVARRVTSMVAALVMAWSMPCSADTKDTVSNDAQLALDWLYRTNPTALTLGRRAREVVVFPKITKAKIIQVDKAVDAAYGEGALIKNGSTTDFRHFISRSWRLQRADESYSVALFVMTPRAQSALAKSGWELNNGPGITIVDSFGTRRSPGAGLKGDAYAFIFGQHRPATIISLNGSTIFSEH